MPYWVERERIANLEMFMLMLVLHSVTPTVFSPMRCSSVSSSTSSSPFLIQVQVAGEEVFLESKVI